MILESEQLVDKAKSNLLECERSEAKVKKRASDASISIDERQTVEEKLKSARRALDFAKLEGNYRYTVFNIIENFYFQITVGFSVTEKISENEIIKLIRVKEGLKKLTESYLGLSQKCSVIMQAQKAVVNELPDEVGVNHELQFASKLPIFGRLFFHSKLNR